VSNLNPINGPPRLIRFHEPGSYVVLDSDQDLVAHLDKEQNILHVDRERYQSYDKLSQHMIDKTHHTYLYVADLPAQVRRAA